MGRVKTLKKNRNPTSSDGNNDNSHKLRRGEPIPKDVLLKLVNENYSGMDIADYFGCSRRRVNVMLRSMDISLHGFKQPGVKISRELREKQYVTKSVSRSEYFTKPVLELDTDENVPAPLSLTHFGLFNKLPQRWGFFIHGAIDVYSRYLLYLELSTNNDAATVLSHFRKGVELKGLPVAVQCADSEESAGVVQFMDLNRPDQEKRILYLKAGEKRNRGMNRLRRVWNDLIRLCLQQYRATFKEMEETGQLDSNNPVDIYCLHQCYTHLMKAALADFQFNWNHHNIWVAGHMTPTHLQFVGHHNLQRRAGLEGIHFPELDEKEIIDVDPDQEWPPTSTPSIYRRVLKKKKDRAELREKFPQESITFQSAPDIYRKMRQRVNKILNRS